VNQPIPTEEPISSRSISGNYDSIILSHGNSDVVQNYSASANIGEVFELPTVMVPVEMKAAAAV
jgi:hypothetical protein